MFLQRLSILILIPYGTMSFPRSSGILLHPTSFPSRFGVGDLGKTAYQFIDFLYESGQQFWQVLPLGPTSYGNSPYMCYSSMAGNPLLISLESLHTQGWLDDADLAEYPEMGGERVDYDRVIALKMPLLLKAAERFREAATVEQRQEYEAFCASRTFWLNDFAFFMALKGAHGDAPWYRWEAELVTRDPEALDNWRLQVANEIFHQKFLQYEFFRQWSDVKNYANAHGIQIIGDIPIYVSQDSADVWAFPENFHLDPETGEPALMAGVPPDYFSATGQLWGNPIYQWDTMKEHDFDWWIERFNAMLTYVDFIRVDHFRGFSAYWAVPQGEETAVNGEWQEGPGDAFFETLRDKLGKLPILAEDLGIITPDVEALRDQFEFPGMKVLHFAYGSDPGNPFLPFNYENRNCVVYTGTHDNDTTVGWFEKLPDWERQSLMNYLGCVSGDGIHWTMIRQAFGSVANLAILPLQDVLGLGSDSRMNYPGTATGNWGWVYRQEMLTGELCDRLRHLTIIFGRAPYPHRQYEGYPRPEKTEHAASSDHH